MKNSKILFIPLIIMLLLHGCKEEACQDVSCLNGGTCVDGQCDCPEGFFGSDCGEVETPESIKLKKVRLIYFPLTRSNGESWDSSSGPDVYFEIFEGDERLISSEYYEDVSPDEQYSWEIDRDFSLTEPEKLHTIMLYDFDADDADDFMESINFTPFDETQGLPNPIILDIGKLAFELEVEYTR